jgi:hypothetical protein
LVASGHAWGLPLCLPRVTLVPESEREGDQVGAQKRCLEKQRARTHFDLGVSYGVETEKMSYPGRGAERRACIVCGTMRLVYPAEARKARIGYFCSRFCRFRAYRLFMEALRAGKIKVEGGLDLWGV